MNLLNLAESFTRTIILEPSNRVTCNLYVSEEAFNTLTTADRLILPTIEINIPIIWQQLSLNIKENLWIQQIRENFDQVFSFSLILVSNKEICDLNRNYRGKDTATDVLTFTLLDESIAQESLLRLPEIDLGEIYISLEWAKEAVCKQLSDTEKQKLNFFHVLTLFILERLVHGCLHLVGVHHKTMPAYNKVVKIQRKVIEALAEKNDKTGTD